MPASQAKFEIVLMGSAVRMKSKATSYLPRRKRKLSPSLQNNMTMPVIGEDMPAGKPRNFVIINYRKANKKRKEKKNKSDRCEGETREQKIHFEEKRVLKLELVFPQNLLRNAKLRVNKQTELEGDMGK